MFDCDGVLVDSEAISNRVLAEMLTAEGLPTTLAQSRRNYQGMLLADICSRAEGKLGRALPGDWLAHYERERDAGATEILHSLDQLLGLLDLG
jgi:beta-phosphoglucomutase-like phosphatase (HAD superfamily)